MNITQRLRSDFNSQIKTVQLINIVLSLIGIIYLATNFNIFYFYISLSMFLIFGILGANIGLHRYFSHRTFEVSRPWQYILSILGTLCTLGSIISWVAVHRYHHLHADTDKDPHSPQLIGTWRAYTYDWRRANISKKFIRDLISDPVVTFTHRHYFKIIFTFILLLLILDPLLVIFAYSIPVTGCLNGVSAVTVISHIHGYRTYNNNDTSRNSWVANLISLGEGWHNNHHARPYNWRQGEKWWEIDPPSWIIQLIRKKK